MKEGDREDKEESEEEKRFAEKKRVQKENEVNRGEVGGGRDPLQHIHQGGAMGGHEDMCGERR